MPETPNIVIVHTDDTGPYGHDIETPDLQRLADDGVLFRNAHCAGPTCSPSRGALLTGSSPHSNGLIGLAHRGFAMDDYGRHLSNSLTERGFETVLAGQQHEVAEDTVEGDAVKEVLGYDRVLESDESAVGELPIDHNHTRSDLAITEAAADYIRETGNEDTAKPFFLSVGLDDTHQPMPLDQDLVDPDYVAPPEPLPDAPPIREEMAAYHVAAQYVDERVGRVIDALEGTDQLEDTVLLFTTDHGIPFPLMKCNLSDGGTGVSVITRFPESTSLPRGVAKDALVSHIDLYPTFCDLLDFDVPEWAEGNSLLPLLRGEVESIREALFSEVTYHAAYEPKRSIRTDRPVRPTFRRGLRPIRGAEHG
ncbi:sulfatase [Halobacteriales archaeon QS_4_62_28]|nr:MAG: sulfatase [Halobacteriales archaeon QS_4_62_28]